MKKALSVLLFFAFVLTTLCIAPLTVNAKDLSGHHYRYHYYANDGSNKNGGLGELYAIELERDPTSDEKKVKNCMFAAPAGKKFKCWANLSDTAYCKPGVEYPYEFCTYDEWINDLNYVEKEYSMKAIWEDISAPISYCVQFSSMSSYPISGQIVEKGEKVVKPNEPEVGDIHYYHYSYYSDPMLNGEYDYFYLFRGWYGDKNYTSLYDFDTPVNSDLTIYVNWDRIASFKQNDCSGKQTESPAINGNKVILPECTFIPPEGKVFDGWKKVRSNHYPDDENVYHPGDEIDITENTDFEPVWVYPNTVTSASCTVTAPMAGQKPDYTAVPADSEAYTATVSEWIYGTGRIARTMTADEEFIEGKTYQAYVKFTSNDGYTFADDATYTINGKAATKTTIRNTDYYVVTFTCQSSAMIGDANLDGKINIRDVTAIQRHIAEIEILTSVCLVNADTNGDGTVDISDATHLQMYLAEYDVVLGQPS